jgi:hypothetical protein
MSNPIEHAACANHRDHIGELWTQITRIDSAKEEKTGSKKASLRISLPFSESPPNAQGSAVGDQQSSVAIAVFSPLSHGSSSCHCFLFEEFIQINENNSPCSLMINLDVVLLAGIPQQPRSR